VVHDPAQPFPRVPVPDDVAERLVYFATFAAGDEALKPGPLSRVRNPDGSVQRETPHEFVRRVVTAGVLHLVEIGLLTVPEDFGNRLEDYLPLQRDDGAWVQPSHGEPGG
jgi:hypothetical protein